MGLFSKKPAQVSSKIIEEFSKTLKSLSSYITSEAGQRRWADLNRMMMEYMVSSDVSVDEREKNFKTINNILKIQRDSCKQFETPLTDADVDDLYSALYGLVNVETDPVKKLIQNMNMALLTGACAVSDNTAIRNALRAVSRSYALNESTVSKEEKERIRSTLSSISGQLSMVKDQDVERIVNRLNEINRNITATGAEVAPDAVDILEKSVADIEAFMLNVDSYATVIEATNDKNVASIQNCQMKMQELLVKGSHAKQTNNKLLYGQLSREHKKLGAVAQSLEGQRALYDQKADHLNTIAGKIEEARIAGVLSKKTEALFKNKTPNRILGEDYENILNSLDIDMSFADAPAEAEFSNTVFDGGVNVTMQEEAAADAFDLGVREMMDTANTTNTNQTV